MIVTSDKIVFIDNPKCASTTMRSYYSQISHKIIFQSTKNISQCNGEFDDPHYVHANAGAILRYLDATQQDVNDFTCFTTIRNPYERFYSHYRYFVKMNENKLSREETSPVVFQERRMTKACFPVNFRFHDKFEVKNVIRVENLNEDLQQFNSKYSIGMNITSEVRLNTSKNVVDDFRFTDQLVNYINESYVQDFKMGQYELETSNELNSRLFEVE